MKIKKILTPLLLMILLASTIAFGSNIPLGPYFDDTYFDLSGSALILKIVPHEKGGLEADVSAYDGLILITGGATSNLTIGIADDNIVEIDDADAAVDDYCKLTANGIVGRSYSEVKTDLGVDLTLYYLKTEMDSFSELQAIIADKTLINEEDPITLDNDLNMGTHKITGVVDPVNPQEAATKAYADTKVATEVDPTVDTDAEIKAILVDEVTKTGTLIVENLTKTNNATGVIEDAGVAIETTLTVGSDAKVPTSKAVNDFCETTKNYMQNLEEDTTPELGADLSLNSHNILIYNTPSYGEYSGLIESKNVGEPVFFGDLLYFNWADKTWKKADADLATNMPGLRIALESREALQSCKMLIMGYIRHDDWNFTAAMVYASTTAGEMTSTAPSGEGQQLQRIGMAKEFDLLFFDPSIDVGEIKP